jgi:hypothetical protein
MNLSRLKEKFGVTDYSYVTDCSYQVRDGVADILVRFIFSQIPP